MTDTVQTAPTSRWRRCGQGRLNRLRYIRYRCGLFLLGLGLFFGISFLVPRLPLSVRPLMGFLMLLSVLAVIVLGTLMAIRRVHDFNASGWLAALSLLPVINLAYWFIPGTAGDNRFGAPDAPNRRVGVMMTILLAVLMFLAVFGLSAVAVFMQYFLKIYSASHAGS